MSNTPPDCPRCGAAMRERNGKRGPFYGCSRYPECTAIVNVGAAPVKAATPSAPVLSEEPRSFVVVDTETTGVARDSRIVEVAALLVTDGAIVDQFVSLVRPDVPIPAEASAVHGILDRDVADAPDARAAMGLFLEFVEHRPLLAHNAGFDLGRLAFELDRASIGRPKVPAFCTLSVARRAWPRLGSHKLEVLVERLGIEVDGAHRAEADARACLGVWQAAQRVWDGLGFVGIETAGVL